MDAQLELEVPEVEKSVRRVLRRKNEIKKICNMTIPKNPKKLISYIPRFAGPINFPVIITPNNNIIKILITTIDNIYNE